MPAASDTSNMNKAFFLLLWALSSQGASWEGEVTAVPDCDRLLVLHERQVVEVRIKGIDGPEKGQDYWKLSKRWTTLLTLGKFVRVKEIGASPEGLLIAEILLPNGQPLGPELVKRGMAWWNRTEEPGDTGLAAAEQKAREEFRGLWSEFNPVAPWEWKNQQAMAVSPSPYPAPLEPVEARHVGDGAFLPPPLEIISPSNEDRLQ